MIRSQESPSLVRTRDVGVRRGERWIVRHVDLEMARGSLVFFFGASGAGKSTCVKAILGLIEVSEGSVERAPSLEVGYVPQRLPISPTLPLSVRRLVTLTGGFAPREVDAAVAGGLVGSAELDTPSGPSVVVTALVVFALTRIRGGRGA